MELDIIRRVCSVSEKETGALKQGYGRNIGIFCRPDDGPTMYERLAPFFSQLSTFFIMTS